MVRGSSSIWMEMGVMALISWIRLSSAGVRASRATCAVTTPSAGSPGGSAGLVSGASPRPAAGPVFPAPPVGSGMLGGMKAPGAGSPTLAAPGRLKSDGGAPGDSPAGVVPGDASIIGGTPIPAGAGMLRPRGNPGTPTPGTATLAAGFLLERLLEALVRLDRAAKRFFTALSVRPPMTLAMSVHLFPSVSCASMSFRSSSSVHAPCFRSASR